MIAFVEYHGLASNISGRIPKVGILLIPCFAAIPFTNNQERLAMGLVALAVFLPLMSATRRKNLTGSTTDWALSAAGTLYLGRRSLRRRAAPPDVGRRFPAEWLTDLDSSCLDRLGERSPRTRPG